MSIDGQAIKDRYEKAMRAATASALLGGWNTERAGVMFQSWKDIPDLMLQIRELIEELSVLMFRKEIDQEVPTAPETDRNNDPKGP